MIRPLRDGILLEPLEVKQSEGGLVLTAQVPTEYTRARVVSVGEGTLCDDGETHPVAVEPGAVVYIKRLAGVQVVHTSFHPPYLLVQEIDILGVEEAA